MIDKNVIPTKLLWVDLEMTGLDPVKDLILEVAAEVTDFSFKTVESYETCLKQKKDTVVNRMKANNELIAFVEKHFGDEPAVLAGNSIYNDRMFIKQWMPRLDLKLHYRMLDVSAWKVLMQGKYGVKFEKQEVHRAFDDIQASIAELQYYLDWFKQNAQN
jgi:oligoribonuclease